MPPLFFPEEVLEKLETNKQTNETPTKKPTATSTTKEVWDNVEGQRG